jgi:hypothetical protein
MVKPANWSYVAVAWHDTADPEARIFHTDPGSLRTSLAAALPAYMLPAAIRFRSFPTSNPIS